MKVYSLFTSSGQIEEIKPVPTLPMFCKVYIYGSGMDRVEGAVISEPDKFGTYKVVKISDYNSGFHRIDKYSRPHSKKFGIGTYYSDTFELVDEKTVQDYILKAHEADKRREEERIKREQADKAEVEALPKLYPHLTPVANGGDVKVNLVADLKKNFPNVKFSVRKGGYDSYYVAWTDGPTTKQVTEITNKYEDHATDYTGDFRDYSPSNFNRVFGGRKYIFEERRKSEQVEALKEQAKQLTAGHSDPYKADQLLHELFSVTAFKPGASNYRIERTEDTAGSYSDLYRIAYDTPQEQTPEPIKAGSIQIIDYSEKAIAVIGDTKPIKDSLKALGGRFNFRLNCGPGWIFSKSKLEDVKQALTAK